jgi:ribosomal protein S18 acetylase RimI-like enzyme
MATSASIEILDLRHFSAPMIRCVLDAETEIWQQNLHWDYRNSARLLMQYLDNRMLPGFAALSEGQIIGYAFCVYEESKAVIGDVFALPGSLAASTSAQSIEETLLKHLFELLLNSPQVERIESQLLLQLSGFHRDLFHEAGFQLYRRLFMVRPLQGLWSLPPADLPGELELRLWCDADLPLAARLISAAYQDHPDSFINDQYRSVHGSLRFLNNIVRYAGCGPFSAPASHVVVHRDSHELVAMVLGSRISSQSGHITQLCVHPAYRRRGLARLLLSTAAFHFLRQGAAEISLTVTEANTQAIALYQAEGYACAHTFDAAVWQRKNTLY